ncbi:MAG: TetR/AcrR family transcriptional regulator [Clostridia bacterium]|nr:TetR/AcrR family transcriptional regulator [Clostridia bacterium]
MPENTTAYSKKEIAAFHGLFRLAASGKPFSSIKVQDIATAAGIGKGTLYEYFSSKEEILSRAILYTLEIFLDWIEKQLEEEISLFQVLDMLLNELENQQILPVSSLVALSTVVSVEQRKEFDEKYPSIFLC